MSAPRLQNTRERLGAASWFLCLQFFVAEQVAALGWRGHYSFRRHFISDLGAVTCADSCSRLHGLMNTSFFLQGVLIAAGVLLLPRRFSPGLLGGVARALLLFSALAVAVVGLNPVDVNINVHIMGARSHFGASTLGMLCWGLSLLIAWQRERDATRMASTTLWLAGVACFGDVLLLFAMGPVGAVLGGGLVERVAAYPFPIWLTWMGAAYLGLGRRKRARDL